MSDRNGQLPNSKKTYVSGKLHLGICVPFREISLAPTKSVNGEIEINEPVRVYDTSGPWGDPDFHGDVTQGLPPLRAKWIRERDDVQEVGGRAESPRDDGYLSEVHRASANGHVGNSRFEIRDSKFAMRKPLRGRAGSTVTQLAYARRGIITPEMEFIAIRENQGLELLRDKMSEKQWRNSLAHQHNGTEGRGDAPGIFARFPQNMPNSSRRSS